MTNDRSMDELISQWLEEEAPRELPDRVLRSTFERLRRTPQERRRWPIRLLPSSRLALALAAAIIVLIIGVAALRIGGGPSVAGPGPGISFPAPSAASPPSTPAATVFTSTRYGYSITVTTDWSISSTPGTWNGITDANNHGGDPGTDLFVDPGATFVVHVGVRPIAAGTTLQQWVGQESTKSVLTGCKMGPADPPITVGAGAVVLVRGVCAELDVTNAFLVRDTRGFLVAWANLIGHEAAAQPAFRQVLASLQVR